MSTKKKTILVVDDIESIRVAMRDFLSPGYNVHEADNGVSALDVLGDYSIDAVITDIRMPEMDGLELIEQIKTRWPQTLYALMTAYNVDDYIAFARQNDIWNIIPKTTFLDLRYVQVMLHKMLEGEIFGIEQYFPTLNGVETDFVFDGSTESSLTEVRSQLKMAIKNTDGDLFRARFEIMNGKQNNEISDVAVSLLNSLEAPAMTKQILEELTSNAFTRAPYGGVKQETKSSTKGPVKLTALKVAPDEKGPVNLEMGRVNNNIYLTVTDSHGTLDRAEILYRLERQVHVDQATGLPVGIGDLHGRGLYITREHCDQLIFNIEPGKKTEVIAIIDLEADFRNRAISIFTSDPQAG